MMFLGKILDNELAERWAARVVGPPNNRRIRLWGFTIGWTFIGVVSFPKEK